MAARRAGRVGTGPGFDVYPLRSSADAMVRDGAQASRKPAEPISSPRTQGYQTMETPDGGERPLVRTRSLEEYKKEPNFAKEDEPPAELTLYPGLTITTKRPTPGAWRST